MKQNAYSSTAFNLSRREALSIIGLSTLAPTALAAAWQETKPAQQPLYRISLAEWSLHRELFGGTITNLDFPRVAKRDFNIDAIEYVNSFFKDKARDREYLTTLKKACDDIEVKSLLIMCDGEGRLGDPDEAARTQAVENHIKWLEAAKFLGCHSIRVNASSSGSFEEQQKLAADGLRQLTERAVPFELNVLVENHGGWSSHGQWLAGVMQLVDHRRCGTLPDFGNFNLGGGRTYDRYQGVEEIMPWAKAVSAKSHEFDAQGNERHTDYLRMMKIVVDAGYHGYVGVEYEGSSHPEREGIALTRRLLERVRDQIAAERAARPVDDTDSQQPK